MKKILRSVQSFLTLDQFTDINNIRSGFGQIHNRHRLDNNNWPVDASRHKLVNHYWFNILIHYCSIISVSILVMLIFEVLDIYFIIVIAVLFYLPIYLFLYRPTYFVEFLPNLEAVTKEFEDNERVNLEKCKKEQISTRGLLLLYYVLDKCSLIDYLSPSDKCASLLVKIFGVSQKGIKNELDLLFKKEKRAKIEQRKQIEIIKSFEEVYAIFEEMQFPKGVQMLKEMEIRFNRPE